MLHPYITDFSFAVQIYINTLYLLCKESLYVMKKRFIEPDLMKNDFIVSDSIDLKTIGPEVKNNFIKNQSSKEIDVYSYGVILYVLFTRSVYKNI